MKQKVKEQIYTKDFKGNLQEVRFSDLPKDIQENDIIDIRREEAFFSENNSYDAYTELVVIREREETDEEEAERERNEAVYANQALMRDKQLFEQLKQKHGW